MSILNNFAVGLKAAAEIKPVFSSNGRLSVGQRNFTKKDFYYGIIYSCIDAIANAVASNGFGLYKKGKDQSEDFTHPAIQLLRKPNKFQTTMDVFYLISSHIDTTGRAFLYPVKTLADGIYKEMYVLDPAAMSIVQGDSDLIKGYVYRNPKGVQIPFDADEIVPIFRPNPYDQLSGVSTIEMARRAIEADINAQDFNSSFFANGATPSGALKADGALSELQFQRLKEQFNTEYAGKGNAHKTLILENGLSYQQMQFNQKDMDFVNQRNMTRDEILSIFKVPKTIVAITDDVNRANAETSDFVFMARVVKPRINLIFEKLNSFYLPLFKNTQQLELVADECVPVNKEAALNYDKSAVNVWETVNEVRQRQGLEPIDGGDELQPPQTVSPFGLGFNNGQSKTHKKMLVTKSAKDRLYLLAKKRLLAKSRVDLQNAIKQQIAILVKDISKKELARLRVKGVEDNLQDIVGDTEKWQTLTGEIILDKNTSAFKQSVALVAEYYDLIDEFDLEKSGALAILKDRAKASALSVRETLLQKARAIIEEKISGGETTLRDIRDAVANGIDDVGLASAERIARTEMAFAFNEGAVADMEASGFVKQVKWILGDDACELCQHLSEENDGIFILGEEPEIPVHPNCECDIVPFWD